MRKRIDTLRSEPLALKAMLGLENFVKSTPLTETHAELIKIRASQLNGCAYCLNMHTRDARKAGETEQRIYLISAWRDCELFSKEERAILALTEEMTLIQNGVSDETYERARELFDDAYLIAILMAVVTINSWNRIAITSKSPLD